MKDIRLTNHWDAALSMVGIASLTYLATVLPTLDSRWIVGAVVALAVRSTALLRNASNIGRYLNGKSEE